MLCLLLSSFCLGCGDGDDESNEDGKQNLGTLEDSCDQYCAAMAQVGCPDDVGPGQCRSSCVDLPEFFGGCEKEWMALNYCMADAPLFCERGTAAVKVADCPEVEDFDKCIQAL